jgi:hypothetical protein
MLRVICLSAALALGAVTTAPAQVAQAETELRGEVQAFLDLIGTDRNLEIIIAAGTRDAAGLEADLFPDQGGAAWTRMVNRLYEPGLVQSAFLQHFPGDQISDQELADMTAFFSSDLGQRIIEAEIAAWQAIIDPEVEAAANQVYFDRLAANDPRLALLERLMEANDFVDLNVMGSLNSSFAFYRGMSDGGAYEQEIPQDLMLAEVWQQEPQLRENTTLWLFSYELMAYDGFTDEELETYIAFSETEAGSAYNAALFAAYDAMLEGLTYRLGTAAAIFMNGEPT